MGKEDHGGLLDSSKMGVASRKINCVIRGLELCVSPTNGKKSRTEYEVHLYDFI